MQEQRVGPQQQWGQEIRGQRAKLEFHVWSTEPSGLLLGNQPPLPP